MVPVVLTELLSDPKLNAEVADTLTTLPIPDLLDGFWKRAGILRATVLGKGRKARLGDALIAQFCADHQIPLVTRDREFRAFADAAKLDILLA